MDGFVLVRSSGFNVICGIACLPRAFNYVALGGAPSDFGLLYSWNWRHWPLPDFIVNVFSEIPQRSSKTGLREAAPQDSSKKGTHRFVDRIILSLLGFVLQASRLASAIFNATVPIYKKHMTQALQMVVAA